MAGTSTITISPETRPWTAKTAVFLFGALIFLLILFFPDKRVDEYQTRVSWLLLAVAALLDREGPLRSRLRLLSVLYPATLLLAALPALTDSNEAATAVRYFFRYQNWLLWLAVLWLASPFLLRLRAESPHRDSRTGLPLMIAALLTFDFLLMASGFAAPDVKQAMKHLGAEALPYAGLFVLLTRLLPGYARERTLSARFGLGLLIAVLVAMLGVVAVHAVNGSGAQWLRENEWIRVEQDPAAPKRLQFPFEHHNRAGYFAACAFFLCLAAAAGFRSRCGKTAAVIGAGLAMAVLPHPMTRGAILAAGVGLVVIAAATLIQYRRRLPRAIWILPLFLPLLWFVLPQAHRHHFTTTFRPETVDPDAGNTVVSRFTLWRYTSDMIAERPWFGFGHGTDNFETNLAQRHPTEIPHLTGSSHAHNMWLETAAEAGVPAALAFLAFTLLRIAFLLQAWSTARRTGSVLALPLLLWIGLEIVIQIYGLSNYPLRRNLGLFTYAIWGIGVALALVARTQREPEPEVVASQQTAAATRTPKA